MTRFILLTFVLIAGGLVAQTPKPGPRHANALEFAKAKRNSAPETFSHFLAGGEFGSVFVATPKSPIRPHYHAEHDETVVIVRGSGRVRLGESERKVKSGDVVFVPRGTIHAYLPEVGDEVIVSCFAPVFDGKDRIFVDK